MQFFRSLVFTALIAGSVAGFAAAALHIATTVPLILQAEVYEQGGDIDHHHGGEASEHSHASSGERADQEGQTVLGRNALTLAAMLLAYIGFAMLLVVSAELLGGLNGVRQGIVWGFAGFLVFSLVPAIGLPPELPGMPAADLQDRQIWWVVAAASTAAGLCIAAKGKGLARWMLATALLLLPFISGAPHPESAATAVPSELHLRFVVLTLSSSFITWLLLGSVAGWLLGRRQSVYL
jgi:cobalt transporter subunit CbtA